MRLVLASTSPRRLDLLKRIGVTPDRVAAPDIDEDPLTAELPRTYVQRIAMGKAAAVARESDEIILAGDTTIAVGRRILGKPEDEADLRRMLALLSGRRHHCLSAVCLIGLDGKARTRLSDTIVAFKRLTDAEIDAYVASGEGMGKAGGYAIQGRAEGYVRFLSGSHSGVVGLPVFETRALLISAGYPVGEWLYEAGIGEARAALVEDGVIVKARIELDDLRAGSIVQGRLRADLRVELADSEVLLDRAPGVSEGALITVRITREAIPEPGRAKLAKATISDEPPAPGPDLLARITATGIPVRQPRAHKPDLLEQAGWSEILEEAVTGEIPFPGGALRMAVTPEPTLFDVDGSTRPETLALAAAKAVAEAMERHDITGSIGIDFPTLANKAARLAVADAIDAALPQPFERTNVNGFGFLQIVRRRTRASLPELLAADPAGAKARAELRRLERLLPPLPASHMVSRGVLRRPDWIAELTRRIGGTIELKENPRGQA